ncbi:proline-rich receptor-like protein kinase PERK8 [Iris pallida]|uniref:Proline-rich receptor-like protein kinase PERK8 n=1 Tax=Iris pallida TaxID=29817 RepID=A0AAX6GDD5_IRIPA|nr:proline-rich receptor-like protein kinase PERK8 [Iris pallida]
MSAEGIGRGLWWRGRARGGGEDGASVRGLSVRLRVVRPRDTGEGDGAATEVVISRSWLWRWRMMAGERRRRW